MFDEENQAGGILGYTQRLKSLGGTPGGMVTTPQNTGIGGGLTKPGPLTRAVAATGIAAVPPTDPDTDGRRQYSPNYGDAFANRGGSFAPSGPSNGPDSHALDPVAAGIAAPIQTGTTPVSPGAMRGIAQLPANQRIAEVVGAVDQGAAGVGKTEVRQTVGTHGAANTAENAGIAAAPNGRNEQGVVTAESAQAAMGNPMTRSGGIAGSYDGKGINEIMARENKARGEMIDSMIKAQGGNGIAILGEQQGILAGVEGNRLIGANQRAADRNQIAMRGQDMKAATAADRMASQERIAEKRTKDAGNRMSLPQVRSNAEIDKARERIAGLSQQEIQRRTAKTTNTGRENPDFDPLLERAVTLANRRKFGVDEHFDQRQQVQPPSGTDGDVMTRFRGDAGMKGHKTGQMTDQGLEVFDASGKLIGHYR